MSRFDTNGTHLINTPLFRLPHSRAGAREAGSAERRPLGKKEEAWAKEEEKKKKEKAVGAWRVAQLGDSRAWPLP